jgi:arylsulfatase A-like enzyme
MVVLALLAGMVCCKARLQRPKNVILITLDGARQDHLSFNGYERKTSPNIDWLAEHGTLFTTIITAGCSTKASLTSLLTSLKFSSHGLIGHEDHLPADARTLAEVFKAKGYRTAAFSSTPILTKAMEYGRGFEHYEDFLSLRTDYVRAETVMNTVLEWLQGLAASDKYFIYMHFEEPHPPWYHECPWCDKSNPAEALTKCATIPTDAVFNEELSLKKSYVQEYDGAIWAADNQVGRLVEALRARGDFDHTLIAISTDHGYELLDRYFIGHGYSPFDEVVKLFFVLYGDGKRRSTKQGATIDIGPTLLGSARIAKPPEFEGRDLIREGFARDPIAFTQGYGVVSVRTNRYKLIEIKWESDIPKPKYIREYGFQLFDLRRDPKELVDIKDKNPREFELLKRKLLEYTKKVVEISKKHKAVNKNVDRENLDQETLERLRTLGYIR